MHPGRIAGFICAALTLIPAVLAAQAENRPPRVFPEFNATWLLDERDPRSRIIPGADIAHRIEIVTSATGVVVMKDSAPGEVYRFDNQEPDLPGGAVANFHHIFTLVSETLALTATRSASRDGRTFTTIRTEAYAVDGDVLTVERQLSVLIEPPGNLATFEQPANSRQTFVYRRAPAAPAR